MAVIFTGDLLRVVTWRLAGITQHGVDIRLEYALLGLIPLEVGQR